MIFLLIVLCCFVLFVAVGGIAGVAVIHDRLFPNGNRAPAWLDVGSFVFFEVVFIASFCQGLFWFVNAIGPWFGQHLVSVVG